MSIESRLKKLLGLGGGPALGFDNDEFVIYLEYNAPSEVHELARGKTLKAVVENYEEILRKRQEDTEKRAKFKVGANVRWRHGYCAGVVESVHQDYGDRIYYSVKWNNKSPNLQLFETGLEHG